MNPQFFSMLSRYRASLLRAGAAIALLAALAPAAQAQAYVNATVGGALAPGVYGRINIGNAPPPPLLYAEPMIIHRPTVVMPRAPIYLYVPPGHAKNWGKHCGRYNACNQPVYFVQEPPRRGPPPPHWRPGRDDHRWERDHHHGGKHDRHDKHDKHGKRDRDRDDDRGHGHRH